MNKPESVPGCGNAANNARFLCLVRLGGFYMSANKESLSHFFSDLINGSSIMAETNTRHAVKINNPGASFHDIAQEAKIQRDTARDYIIDYKSMAKFVRDDLGEARDERGRFQPSLITPEHCIKWLEFKAENASRLVGESEGIHKGRMLNLISEVGKLQAFFEHRKDPEDRFAKMSPQWQSLDIKCNEFRGSSLVAEIASTPKEVRAYNNPDAVLSALRGIDSPLADRSVFVAEMQDRLGLRVDNARSFTLNANQTISFFSKGHMLHNEYKIPKDLYDRAIALNGGHLGKCEIMSYRTYLDHLKTACAAAGEKYSGSHSWRHTYAHRRYDELRAEGKSDARAKAIISVELFHKRLDIVNEYLR